MRILTKMNVSSVQEPIAAMREAGVGDDDFKTETVLGTIVGLASGVSFRKNNFGDVPSAGLTGVFEAIPVDGSEGARAPVLFMPSAVQDLLVAAVLGSEDARPAEAPKAGQKIDVVGQQVKIMFEVAVVRNANKSGAGYQYIVNQLGEVEKIDILESLKAEIATGKAAALPAPKTPSRHTALNAPAKKPGARSAKKKAK